MARPTILAESVGRERADTGVHQLAAEGASPREAEQLTSGPHLTKLRARWKWFCAAWRLSPGMG
jgi:hypothetical protein